MMKKDLSGRRYGKLTVVRAVGRIIRGIRTPRPLITYECLCYCGITKVVAGQDLQHSRTLSCGCSRSHEEDQSLRAVWYQYTAKARETDMTFELTKEEFYDLILKACYYCGSSSSNLSTNKYNKKQLTYNGIDRKDNRAGYILSNCVPCCIHCNRAKRTMTVDEFLNLVIRIYKNRIER